MAVYPTDLTDAQTTNFRAVVDGILYLLRSGCQWRLLPTQFPPWQMVYRWYAFWRRKGVWRKVHAVLYAKVRRHEKRCSTPSAVVIDSQSVKTGKVVPKKTRGFDGGKRIKGRKRHLVTDTLGLMVEAAITPANVHDTKGGQKVVERIAKRPDLKDSIEVVHGDKAYAGSPFKQFVRRKLQAIVKTSENLTRVVKKFVPAKQRWVIERSFAWLGDYYRLKVDNERDPRNSLTMLRIASINVMLRRLHPLPVAGW